VERRYRSLDEIVVALLERPQLLPPGCIEAVLLPFGRSAEFVDRRIAELSAHGSFDVCNVAPRDDRYGVTASDDLRPSGVSPLEVVKASNDMGTLCDGNKIGSARYPRSEGVGLAGIDECGASADARMLDVSADEVVLERRARSVAASREHNHASKYLPDRDAAQ
jgi:hypothetical protein